MLGCLRISKEKDLLVPVLPGAGMYRANSNVKQNVFVLKVQRKDGQNLWERGKEISVSGIAFEMDFEA